MRIVVTGGAGFIGSHLTEELLKQGHSVVIIDNFITGSRKNLEHLPQDKLCIIEHDITKPIYLADKVDRIYHLASPASPIDYQKLPIPTLKVGALGSHNMLGMAKAHGARLLLASTSEVYGDPEIHPQKETYWGNVNPVGPRGCYDESKRFAEAIVVAYRDFHKVDTRIIRIFNTYGPRMRLNDGRVVPAFISEILSGKNITIFGDGSQTRSFCYVSDLVRGMMAVMEQADQNPINLGNPAEITIRQFAEKIIELTGLKADMAFLPLPQDDPKRRQPDITRAKTLLKWEPVVGLDEGLRKTIEWAKRMSEKHPVDKHIAKILIAPDSIQKRIAELGEQISNDYAGKELVIVCILKGAFLFTSDLCRRISLPQKLDFMAVSSYGDSTRSSGIVKIDKDLSESIQGKHVLIVEDIIDSGLTMSYIVKILQDRQPADIKICVLCNKPSNQQQFVKVDYCGFKLEDEFVVGYGLDFKGYLRNLPYIGIVKDEYR